MSGLKRGISRILLLCITVCSVIALSSCSNSSQSGKYLVYYTNATGDDISYKEYWIENDTEMEAEELTNLLTGYMFHAELEDEQLFSAKPENVTLNGFSVNGGQIVFDFSASYLEMSNVQEIMLRASIVLTVIQQPEITQVLFTIDGEPLTDSNGRAIGAMNASNFVDVLLSEEGMLKQETDLTIFFTDETGTKLIPAKYHFTIKNSNTSMEEYILQQLKEGPAIESTYRTMASDVEILSVLTTDYVCYINFGSNFLEQEQPASDEILIYSIVNSLCSLPYVNSVQFLVNGSSDVKLHTVDLSIPFTRNKDLEQ